MVDRYGMKVVEYAVLGGCPKTVELLGGWSGGDGFGRSSLAALRQSTDRFRWNTLVRKEVALSGLPFADDLS